MNGPIPTHVTKTLEELKQQLNAKLNEAKKILNAINTLEESYSQAKTTLSELETNLAVSGQITESLSFAPTLAGGTLDVRPDEFLGDPPLIAAKKYIEKAGRAVPLDDIANAVQRGGASIRGSDWREKLETSLVRSTLDVVKVRKGIFGLKKFYTQEQLEGLRSARRRSEPVGKGKRRGRKRGRPRKQLEKAEKVVKEEQTGKGPQNLPKVRKLAGVEIKRKPVPKIEEIIEAGAE